MDHKEIKRAIRLNARVVAFAEDVTVNPGHTVKEWTDAGLDKCVINRAINDHLITHIGENTAEEMNYTGRVFGYIPVVEIR